MSKLIILIPLFPAIGALINGIFGGWAYKKKVVNVVACGSVLLSLITTLVLAFWLIGSVAPADRVDEQIIQYDYATFIEGGTFHTVNESVSTFKLTWSFQFDPLSCIMALIVCGIGFLIHIYSIGYMAHEEAYWRFFCYLNLFMFSMLVLILSANFLGMFLGWEGVGLCSYLLIGFYYKEDWPANASKKAFITNRVGDFAMILCMGTMFAAFGSLDFSVVSERALALFNAGDSLALSTLHLSPEGLLTLIGILLLFAATAKSAQIPLYVWLPDAMAGPTPVSALIHAATMVTAGVYIITRMNVIYQLAPTAMLCIAVVGCVTAIFAASMGLMQDDLKKVLAYSTISQLGYMFLGLGVGAFVGGIFHLMTHAFFKALLFLGAGSVIHAMSGEQDMWKMGKLKNLIPKTHFTFLMGTIAISGVLPFAGLVSKDEILTHTLLGTAHNAMIMKGLWIVGMCAALMTSFYMFRLYFVTFHGKDRMTEEARAHVHESPATMTVPLTILAVLAVFGGLFGIPMIKNFHLLKGFLAPVVVPVGKFAHAHHAVHDLKFYLMESGLILLSISVGAVGCFWAWKWYGKGNDEVPARLKAKFLGIYTFVKNKYYIDELYQATFIRGTYYLGVVFYFFDKWFIDMLFVNGVAFLTKLDSYISAWLDKHLVDGIVNSFAWATNRSSAFFRRMQTGMVQSYAFVFLLGIFAVLCIYMIVINSVM